MTNIALQINLKNHKIALLLFFFSLYTMAFYWNLANAATRENDVVIAVRNVGPAVVNVSSEYEIRKKTNPFSSHGMDPWFDHFFHDFFSPELEQREKRSSLGSGVIIDGKRGYVVTNAHVVEKASIITISLKDQREFTASIVGLDPDSDLAVLKIESEQNLPSVAMGDSDDIMIGESVIAIGNPFGFSHTVTTGVVSAIDRSIKADNRVFHKFIQTDASINPGNSGGPLLNINGELIGINTAIYAQAQGIGFAIPINRAKRIVSDLINYGEVVQAWIGISVQPIDPNLAAYLDIDEINGVIVSAVETDSPSEQADIREGDVITSINGKSVGDTQAYDAAIKEIIVDQTVSFIIHRNGKSLHINVKAGLFPMERALEIADRLFGINVTGIDGRVLTRYGMDSPHGVLITKMRRNTYLYRIGVHPGDIIHRIDEKDIENIEDFKEAMIKYRNKSAVVILLQRDRHLYNINVELGDNRS